MASPVPNTETFDQYRVIDNEQFSQHLTRFLNSKSDEGYVLNLNAEWGAGKTTFLQCWYNELSKNHPVVYFDAWKSDFSKDAMLALVDCFQSQLKNPRSDNKKFAKDLLEKSPPEQFRPIPLCEDDIVEYQMFVKRLFVRWHSVKNVETMV